MRNEKEIKKNPMFLYLAVLTISSTIGLQAWLTLFNNFAVDIAGLDGNHVGVIQSLREVPGFLALLAVYIIKILKEHRLSTLSILVKARPEPKTRIDNVDSRSSNSIGYRHYRFSFLARAWP